MSSRHMFSTHTSGIRVILAAIVLVGLAGNGWTFIQMRADTTQQETRLRWFNPVISYYLQPPGTADIPGTGEFDLIRNAFAAWEGVATANVSFQESTIAPVNRVAVDGVNCLSFAPLSIFSGAIATTYVTSDVFTGSILDVDIVFNDFFLFTDNTRETNVRTVYDGVFDSGMLVFLEGWVNLQDVATHEIGHMLGLDHTFLDDVQPQAGDPSPLAPNRGIGATMYPYADVARGARNLKTDDRAGVSAIYPLDLTGFGEIRGRITNALVTGSPVFGAHVVAVNVNNGRDVVSAVTARDGSFRIQGLPPGSYYILAEPLDPSLLGTYFQDAEDDFPPEFYAVDAFGNDIDLLKLVGPEIISPLDAIPVGVTPVQVTAGAIRTGINFDVYVGFGGVDEYEDIARRNDSPETASNVEVNQNIFASIDPAGDVDFYRFFGNRGDQVVIEVRAQRIGSPLIPVLDLYKAPGRTQDIIAHAVSSPELGGDASITVELPRSGAYYVAVGDVNPMAGGPNYLYVLSIEVRGQMIPMLANSDPTSVINLPLVAPSNRTYLRELTIHFIDKRADNSFTLNDLRPISSNLLESGVTVFNDTGLFSLGDFYYDPNNPGASDVPIPLDTQSGVTVWQSGDTGSFFVKLRFKDMDPRARVPQTPDEIPDFFVVVRTSSGFHQGDQFKAVIPAQGIVMKDYSTGIGREVILYPDPVPLFQNTYVSDAIKLVSLSGLERRVDISSDQPVEVIGINGVAPGGQNLVLSKVRVNLYGYSAKLLSQQLMGLYQDISALYPGVDSATKVRQVLTFDIFDLAPPQEPYVSEPDPGAVSIFRDITHPLGNKGRVDVGIDRILPVRDVEPGEFLLEDIPPEEIPAEIVMDLIPGYLRESFLFEAWRSGVEFHSIEDWFLGWGNYTTRRAERDPAEIATLLGMQGFRITIPIWLPADRPDLLERALIPSNDTGNDRGIDFLIAISTSSRIRAHDTFVATIDQDGIELLPDFGQTGRRPVQSLAMINTRTSPERTRYMVCRPRPRFIIDDLTVDNPVMSPPEQGSLPYAVFGINASDFQQNHMVFPVPGSAYGFWAQVASFFNQDVIFSNITARFMGENTAQFTPRILKPIRRIAIMDPYFGYLDSGMAIYVEDNTPTGNLMDDDGDGLIDEEIVNLIDDDADGVIDEPDWGDGDPAGVPGVFDEYDDPIPFPFSRRTWIDISSNAYLVQEPEVTDNPDGSRLVSMDLTAGRTDEEPLVLRQLMAAINDPMSATPFVFIRPDFTPLWYYPSAPSPDPGDLVSIQNAGWWSHGFYANMDGVSLEDFLDLQYTYNYLQALPDEDIGPHRGSNYYVVLRAGDGALTNDRFRVQIPANGISYDVYQNPVVSERVYPGTAPDATFGGNNVIIVGSGRTRPSMAIIAPGTGENYFIENHRYTIRWTDEAPQGEAWIRLYMTDFPGSTKRILLNETPIPASDGANTYLLDIADSRISQLLSQAGIYPRDEFDILYVVGEIHDGVGNPVVVFSEGGIRLNPIQFLPSIALISPGTGTQYIGPNLLYDAIEWIDSVAIAAESNAVVNLYFNFEPTFAGAIPIPSGQRIPALPDVRIPDDGKNPPPGIDQFVLDLAEMEIMEASISLRDLVNRPIYIIAQLNDGRRPPVYDISKGFLLIEADVLANRLRYEKLLNTGTIVPSYGAPRFGVPDLVQVLGQLGYFVDMEINPEETGAVVTNLFGSVYVVGHPGVFMNLVQQRRSSMIVGDIGIGDPSVERAVDVEADWDNANIYVATSRGRVFLNGDMIEDAVPNPVPPTHPEYGRMEIRDMELLPDGSGLILLTGGGQLIGRQGALENFGDVRASVGDAFDAVDYAPLADGSGGIVITKSGKLIPVGSLPQYLATAVSAVSDGAWLPAGREVVNGEIRKNGRGLILLDNRGRVHGIGDALLPPDRDLSNAFRDIELIGEGADAIVDLIRQYARGYEMEDSRTLMNLMRNDYFDSHGRTRQRLETSLQNTFDFYHILAYGVNSDATACPTDYTIPYPPNTVNPYVSILGMDATAEAWVCFSAFTPTVMQFTGPSGSEDTLEMNVITPVTQRVAIYEAGDGRGDTLEIWDWDFPSEEFSIFENKRIFDWTFTNARGEGPKYKTLQYEGPSQNNTYVFRIRPDLRLPQFGPAEVLIAMVEEGAEAIRSVFPLRFDFQDQGSGFEIRSVQSRYDFPTSDEGFQVGEGSINRGIIGFSFLRGAPGFSFKGNEVDFRLSGDEFHAIGFAPTLGGIVNITEKLGVRDLQRFRYDSAGRLLSREQVLDYVRNTFVTQQFVGDLSNADFLASVPAVVGNVYLARITEDPDRFGLFSPIALSDGGRVILDWFYVEEFRLSLSLPR